jgi:hypothetical protein
MAVFNAIQSGRKTLPLHRSILHRYSEYAMEEVKILSQSGKILLDYRVSRARRYSSAKAHCVV